MVFDGNNREYIIYIPSNYDGSESVPLMFNFHGGNGLASDFMNYTNVFNLLYNEKIYVIGHGLGAMIALYLSSLM